MRYSALTTVALAVPGLANFHIGRADKVQNPLSPNWPPVSWEDWTACPSNYFGCKCYGGITPKADRGVGTVANHDTRTNFSLESGLCGMGQLDFYFRSNDNKWEFYKHGGDGTLEGTCFPNSTHDLCSLKTASLVTVNYYDYLVCYSYICEP